MSVKFGIQASGTIHNCPVVHMIKFYAPPTIAMSNAFFINSNIRRLKCGSSMFDSGGIGLGDLCIFDLVLISLSRYAW